uniref:Uncharacterized protein n=1 Tax=Kalanchoe fedtschenkoi TaxID=63787 RepID=A0A7N0TDJ3_KALFE
MESGVAMSVNYPIPCQDLVSFSIVSIALFFLPIWNLGYGWAMAVNGCFNLCGICLIKFIVLAPDLK